LRKSYITCGGAQASLLVNTSRKRRKEQDLTARIREARADRASR
jgi:hypothetical protein